MLSCLFSVAHPRLLPLARVLHAVVLDCTDLHFAGGLCLVVHAVMSVDERSLLEERSDDAHRFVDDRRFAAEHMLAADHMLSVHRTTAVDHKSSIARRRSEVHKLAAGHNWVADHTTAETPCFEVVLPAGFHKFVDS